MKHKLTVLLILLISSIGIVESQTQLNINRFRISASAGIGYLFAEGEGEIEGVSSNVTNDIYKELRWLTNLNGDIHYMINGNYGLGAKYIFQANSAGADNVIIDPYDGVHYLASDIWENDYLNYTGASFGGYTDIGNSGKLKLFSSLSVGYLWIRSEASVFNQNILATGGNFGMNFDFSLDYIFHPNLGLGFNLGTLYGVVYKVKLTDGSQTVEQKLDKNSRYNASNIYLSLGLRCYINR